MSPKSIAFLIVLAAMGVSSWWMTLRARRILRRSLGREIKAGEETSLRTWMSVPDRDLATAAQEIGDNPIERTLGAATVLDAATRLRPRRESDPDSDHLSIR
jgi:hypothetical protein